VVVAAAESVQWFAAWSTTSPLTSCTLCVDADDQLFRPTDCDPWGAAARVADFGGYSPAATIFTTALASPLVVPDAFGRTVTGNTDWSECAKCEPSASAAGFRYFEFAVEAAASSGTSTQRVGLAQSGHSVNTGLGDTALSWCLRANGDYRANSANVASGIGAAAVVVGSRIGFVISSGGNVWVSHNSLSMIQGNPETGALPVWTGVVNVGPAATPGVDGRIRLCTHAREQLYRPSYAEAWDGADILPEQHYRGTLDKTPRIVREISFQPWASRPNKGGLIGSVDIANADGFYDKLSNFNLRNQKVIGYRNSGGSVRREWTALADNVEMRGESSCSVKVADPTAALDVRVASPVFALGNPKLIPATAREGSTITSNVSQTTFGTFDVYDRALIVSSWVRSDVLDVSGFTRTVNPAGRQSVRNLVMQRVVQRHVLANEDLSAWSAGSPVSWTKYTKEAGDSITQSGTQAVFAAVTTGSGGVCGLWHAFSFVVGKRYAIRVAVTAFASNFAPNNFSHIILESVAGANYTGGASGGGGGDIYWNNIGAVGVMTIVFTCTVAFNGFTIYCLNGDGLTVDGVELYEVAETITPQGALSAILDSVAWEYSSPPAPYSPGVIGYWSDQRPTARAVLGELCASLLCDYYVDANGILRFAWMTPPEEVTASSPLYCGEIFESELLPNSFSVADDAAPNLSTLVEYQRNYIKHSDGDIAGAVTAVTRQYFTSERKENKLALSGTAFGDAPALHPFYSHANDAAPMPRLLVNDFTASNTPVNGSATVDNRHIMLHRYYGKRRKVPANFGIARDRADALALAPGKVVKLRHSRHGFTSCSAASTLNIARVSAAGLTFDAFERRLSPPADATWRQVAGRVSHASGTERVLRYFEMLVEAAGSSTQFGIGRTSAALSSYVGSTVNDWGHSTTAGATRHNGAENATGAITANVIGKRVGVLWDSVNSVWFMVDGVLVGGGDPVANTGARYTNVTGTLEPRVSQLGATVGRAQLITAAEDMLFLPRYAQAWDQGGKPLLISRIEIVDENTVRVSGAG
jgi:hypothetical protein